MVIVVGSAPEEIRVTRDQYLGLLSQLDAATHSKSPGAVALAYGLLGTVRSWFLPGKVTGQTDGQLELPLEWDEERAER